MKKLLLATLFTSSLSADSYLQLGVAQMEYTYPFFSDTNLGYNLAYGGEGTFDNGIYAGMTMYVNMGESASPSSAPDTERTLGLGIDGKLGYEIFSNFSLYGILGYTMQGVYNSKESQFYNHTGLGYGAGATYQINSWLGFDVEYKTYSGLSFYDNGGTRYGYQGDIDITSLGANLKIFF